MRSNLFEVTGREDHSYVIVLSKVREVTKKPDGTLFVMFDGAEDDQMGTAVRAHQATPFLAALRELVNGTGEVKSVLRSEPVGPQEVKIEPPSPFSTVQRVVALKVEALEMAHAIDAKNCADKDWWKSAILLADRVKAIARIEATLEGSFPGGDDVATPTPPPDPELVAVLDEVAQERHFGEDHATADAGKLEDFHDCNDEYCVKASKALARAKPRAAALRRVVEGAKEGLRYLKAFVEAGRIVAHVPSVTSQEAVEGLEVALADLKKLEGKSAQ